MSTPEATKAWQALVNIGAGTDTGSLVVLALEAARTEGRREALDVERLRADLWSHFGEMLSPDEHQAIVSIVLARLVAALNASESPPEWSLRGTALRRAAMDLLAYGQHFESCLKRKTIAHVRPHECSCGYERAVTDVQAAIAVPTSEDKTTEECSVCGDGFDNHDAIAHEAALNASQSPRDLLRLLADLVSFRITNDAGECSWCEVDSPARTTDHRSSCPWRKAQEIVHASR